MDGICESCGRNIAVGERHKATEPKPSLDELEAMVSDSVCSATDGCEVEPDGKCEHGHSSWLIVLGLI